MAGPGRFQRLKLNPTVQKFQLIVLALNLQIAACRGGADAETRGRGGGGGGGHRA